VSPRLLWSFAYHFPTHHLHDVLRSGAFVDATGVDWGFLERRKREMSEKAVENKRQKRAGEKNNSGEQALAAVESLEEDIMAQMTATTTTSSSAPSASRPVLPVDGWQWTIPSTPDVAALQLCFDFDVSAETLEALSAMGVANVFQLACKELEELPREAREGLVPAQEVVVEEITRRIVNQVDADFDRLVERNVATVADLVMFKGVEQVLVDLVGEQARLWVVRAAMVAEMEDMDWINEWKTV